MELLNNLKGISVLSKKQMRNVKGGESGGGSGESDKVKACSGKALCASCSWVYEGKTYHGKCSQNIFAGTRYCSDLNCHYAGDDSSLLINKNF